MERNKIADRLLEFCLAGAAQPASRQVRTHSLCIGSRRLTIHREQNFLIRQMVR
jgi:hypothetical protein